MSDRQPLDLRALGDVDSPELVHAALATFRRRIITRYVWILLLAVLLVAGVVWGRTPSDLAGRVDQARTYSTQGETWRVDGVTVGLSRVADLGDTLGLRFEVLEDPGLRPPTVAVTGSLDSQGVGHWTKYVEVTPPRDGILTVTLRQGRLTQRFTIDLAEIYVPASYWKG